MSLAVLALAAAGLLTSGTLLGATSAAAPFAGKWQGGGRLLQVSGDLATGFSVAAAESWTIIGCPISTGTVLSRYTPKGGSSYEAQYLWTENENGVCSSSTRGPETVTVVASGSTLSITGCGYAFCGTLTRVGAAPGTTTGQTTTTAPKPKPKPTTVPRPAKDTSPPRVRALPGPATTPASRTGLEFTIGDDSGRARAHTTLYEGGQQVRTAVSGFGPATGATRTWQALFAADLVGPMYFCVWADDAAGNKSATSCAWIPMTVPVEKVSNGCGGGGWDALVAAQNYLGDTHTYQQSLGRSYTVSFVAACNLHDAGYGGHTVRDAINGGTIDFRTWSRQRVDRSFLGNMRTLCTRQIPARAANARAKCYSTGGTLSIGALALYNFVDRHGWRFFDADLTKPGLQRIGHRANFGR
jgi:hypothetical protein